MGGVCEAPIEEGNSRRGLRDIGEDDIGWRRHKPVRRIVHAPNWRASIARLTRGTRLLPVMAYRGGRLGCLYAEVPLLGGYNVKAEQVWPCRCCVGSAK